MEVFYTIVFSIIGFVILLSLIGFLLPKTSHVERSVEIKAPAEELFSQVNNLRNFVIWSPWSEKDPNLEQVFTGPEEGKGAVYQWKGNREVREGEITIIESRPHDFVQWDLKFGQSKMNTTAYFKLENKEHSVIITWGFDAQLGNNPTSRYMGLLMKGFIGKDFQKGLINLKDKMEA